MAVLDLDSIQIVDGIPSDNLMLECPHFKWKSSGIAPRITNPMFADVYDGWRAVRTKSRSAETLGP